MAIKNWTENTPYNFIRAGTIKLGEKGKKGAPEKRDHFVVPEEVAQIYGNQPKALDIVLPDEEEFMSSSLKRYDGNNNLICHSDGEKAAVSVNRLKYKPEEYSASVQGNKVFINNNEVEVTGSTENHQWANFKCPYKKCPHYKGSRCKETVILYFCLTKVPGTALQVYSITTRSYNTYHHLLIGAKELRKRFGRASFIPVKLKVKMEEKQVPGERFKNEVPILYLDFDEPYEKVWEQTLQGKMVWSLAPVNNICALPPTQEDESGKEEEQHPEQIHGQNEGSSELNEAAQENKDKTPENEEANNSESEKTTFTVINEAKRGKHKGETVAKMDIAIHSTRELATLWARGQYIETIKSYQKDQKYEAYLIPIQGMEQNYELKEEPHKEEEQQQTA